MEVSFSAVSKPILQLNILFAAFRQLCKICALLHRSKFNMLSTFHLKISEVGEFPAIICKLSATIFQHLKIQRDYFADLKTNTAK